MKLVFLLGLLMFACQAKAQVLSFDPERIVSVELANGQTLFGRIVDADTQQLHLVGARVNQLLPFSLLSESSRKSLNLLSHKPSEAAPIGEFQGLNSTRKLLKESQQELISSNPRSQTPMILPATWAYPLYPYSYGYPSPYRKNCAFSGNILITF
jgi:hypothetical protein